MSVIYILAPTIGEVAEIVGHGHSAPSLPASLCMIVSCIGTYAYFILTRNLDRAVVASSLSQLVFFSWGLIAADGIREERFFLLSLFPLANGFLLGRRAAAWTAIYTLGLTSLLAILESKSVIVPVLSPVSVVVAQAAIGLSAIYLFVYSYERMREKADLEANLLNEQLSTQHSFLDGILNAAPSIIFVKDLEGRYLKCNDAYAQLLHRKPDEIVGRSLFDLFPKEAAKQMKKNDREVLEMGVPRTFEEILPTSTGPRWHLVTLFPIKEANGTITALGGILSDIHEAKSLHLAYDSLNHALDQSAIVAMTDLKGRITYANKKFTDISGYSLDEIIGKDHRIVNSGIHPKSFFQEMWQTIKAGNVWSGEIQNRRKDGSTYWVNTTISPIRSLTKGENGFVAIRFDTTAQKLGAERLMQTAKMSSLGEMAAGIAHEINNPLQIITTKVSRLNRQFEKQGPLDFDKLRTELADISRTSDRISKIVKGLRLFSRDSENETFETVSIKKIIEDTLDLCGERLTNFNVVVRLSCEADVILECRPTQISQILMNLLNNAHDAIEPLKARWIHIDVAANSNDVEVSVTDSGSGIPKNIADKLMQPFFTTKASDKGTGLGLSISSGIATSHHGTLRYDSSSVNTRFVLKLPLKQTTAAA